MIRLHAGLLVVLICFFFAGLYYGYETQINNDLWQVSTAVSKGKTLQKCRAEWAKRRNVWVDADGPSGDPTNKNAHVVVLRLNNNRLLSPDSTLTLVFENGVLKKKSYVDFLWFD